MNDPLFRRIAKTDLEDALFHDEIRKLVPNQNRVYSTDETSKMILEKKDGESRIGVPPGSLRHYISNMDSYIAPMDIGGRNKRLNYESIFRLQMIYLLKDQYGLAGLQRLVGIIGTPLPANEDIRDLTAPNDIHLKKLIGILAESGILIPGGEAGLQVSPGLTSLAERVNKIEESQKLLLETTDTNGTEEIQNKIKELEEKVTQQETYSKEEIRQQRFDDMLLKKKIENQLRIDALREWGRTPESERMKKVGWFSRVEDEAKREIFIQNYIDDHYEERMKEEMGLQKDD